MRHSSECCLAFVKAFSCLRFSPALRRLRLVAPSYAGQRSFLARLLSQAAPPTPPLPLSTNIQATRALRGHSISQPPSSKSKLTGYRHRHRPPRVCGRCRTIPVNRGAVTTAAQIHHAYRSRFTMMRHHRFIKRQINRARPTFRKIYRLSFASSLRRQLRPVTMNRYSAACHTLSSFFTIVVSR